MLAAAGIALPLPSAAAGPAGARRNAGRKHAPRLDVPEGHFYTQTRRAQARSRWATSSRTTADATLWHAFRTLGGPGQLGYTTQSGGEDGGETLSETVGAAALGPRRE